MAAKRTGVAVLFLFLLGTTVPSGKAITTKHNVPDYWEFYFGLRILKEVSKIVLFKHDFPAIKSTSTREAVRPVCPLLGRYLEIRDYVNNGNPANETEMKAAEIILNQVINDTCDWIATLKDMSSFHCSSNELVSLESLCIELNIHDTIEDLDTPLLPTYYGSTSGELLVLNDRKQWIANRFSDKNETVIEDALNIINKHPHYDCVQKGTNVTC